MFAASAAGQYARLREAIKNVMEEIGGALLPGLTRAADSLRGWVTQLRTSTQFHDALRSSITILGTAFHAVGLAITSVAPALRLFARTASDVARFAGAGGILAAAAAWKSVTVAIGLATSIQARYATTVKGTATAEAQAAALQEAYSAAIEENTAVLLVNIETLRAHAIALGADAAAFDATVAAAGLSAARTAAATEQTAVAASRASRAFAFLGGTTTLVQLAAIGLGFGLYKLLTRETELEKQNKRLTETFTGLAGAIGAVKDNQDKLADLRLEVPSLKAARDAAKLAVERDREALATSKAAKASLEYRTLQNQLASDQSALASSGEGASRRNQLRGDTARRVAEEQVHAQHLVQQAINETRDLGRQAAQSAAADPRGRFATTLMTRTRRTRRSGARQRSTITSRASPGRYKKSATSPAPSST